METYKEFEEGANERVTKTRGPPRFRTRAQAIFALKESARAIDANAIIHMRVYDRYTFWAEGIAAVVEPE